MSTLNNRTGSNLYSGGSSIAHYYGDIVRGLFIAVTLLMLVTSPLYSTSLRTTLPILIVASISLVVLAALTNPRSVSIIRLDAVAAGVGVVVFEVWALITFNLGSLLGFVLLEAIAVLFVFAFYFSLKTLRAMVMGLVENEILDGEEPVHLDTTDSKFEFDEHGEPTTDAFGNIPARTQRKGNH